MIEVERKIEIKENFEILFLLYSHYDILLQVNIILFITI